MYRLTVIQLYTNYFCLLKQRSPVKMKFIFQDTAVPYSAVVNFSKIFNSAANILL